MPTLNYGPESINPQREYKGEYDIRSVYFLSEDRIIWNAILVLVVIEVTALFLCTLFAFRQTSEKTGF